MGKKVIQGNLEVTQSVESTGIHIKEVPHANIVNISKSVSVDQTASEITFNSSARKTGDYSRSGSTSLTYSGIEMTRTEKLLGKGQSGEETTDTYSIWFPLKSGTLALTSDFASVATSGSYNDLSNTPTIPTKTSNLTNDSGFITGVSWDQVTNKPAVATQDDIQNIREVAEGKTKTYILDYTTDVAYFKTQSINPMLGIYLYNSATNQFDIDIKADVMAGSYDDKIKNSSFNSQEASIGLNPYDYIAFMTAINSSTFHVIKLSQELSIGDVILVKQTDVPDR